MAHQRLSYDRTMPKKGNACPDNQDKQKKRVIVLLQDNIRMEGMLGRLNGAIVGHSENKNGDEKR